jgi:hypothetical protein
VVHFLWAKLLRSEKLMSCPSNRIAVLLLTLSIFCACSLPPADNPSNPDSQKLPFDRTPRENGISPSQTLVPSTTKLPEGTPLPIRLQSGLSSASTHAGDTFSAVIDEPVVVEGQTLLDRGISATGRVLEAKPAVNPRGNSMSSRRNPPEPGYLRIVLTSLDVGGKQVMIYTSSIFVKGGSREDRNSATGASSESRNKDRGKDKDVVFAIDRRLNFRLAQTVDLQ